jgi:hypothetical protein
MFVGIGIGVGRQKFATSAAPPSGFATTQWQLLTTTAWNLINETWN